MKEQALAKLVDTIGIYNLKVSNISKFKFNKIEEELFCNMLQEFAKEYHTEQSKLFGVGKPFNDKHKTNNEVLRIDLIEFLEANNYFISTLETKENAIGIVDSYINNYKL